jgi:hypothetical protein
MSPREPDHGDLLGRRVQGLVREQPVDEQAAVGRAVFAETRDHEVARLACAMHRRFVGAAMVVNEPPLAAAARTQHRGVARLLPGAVGAELEDRFGVGPVTLDRKQHVVGVAQPAQQLFGLAQLRRRVAHLRRRGGKVAVGYALDLLGHATEVLHHRLGQPQAVLDPLAQTDGHAAAVGPRARAPMRDLDAHHRLGVAGADRQQAPRRIASHLRDRVDEALDLVVLARQCGAHRRHEERLILDATLDDE